MTDYPPCMLCNHSEFDHPVVGFSKKTSACQHIDCGCPGYIAHRNELYRELEPSPADKSPEPNCPESMADLLAMESRGTVYGEATLFGQFDDHPFFGGHGELMLRGVEPGEVPQSMRAMMRVSQGGNVMLKTTKKS